MSNVSSFCEREMKGNEVDKCNPTELKCTSIASSTLTHLVLYMSAPYSSVGRVGDRPAYIQVYICVLTGTPPTEKVGRT